jgi:squalene-hopene/tetraprenyl-beta-curcumene cyclase
VTTRNFVLALDRALGVVGRSPWKPLRRRAIARAIEWIVRHQDKNGQWGGIQPAMLNSVLALHAVGFAPDHPAIASGIAGVDDFLECEGTLMYQPCVSPNWDTALAMKALLEAGMDPSHPALGRGADWLVANQIFRPGDWSVLNPRLEPGGWAFEFANDSYPDVDDSAVILMVLRELPIAATQPGKRAIAYGLNWTLGMESRDGGWGAFDTDNTAAS